MYNLRADTPLGRHPLPLGRHLLLGRHPLPLGRQPQCADTPSSRRLLQRTVRILLECIFFFQFHSFREKMPKIIDHGTSSMGLAGRQVLLFGKFWIRHWYFSLRNKCIDILICHNVYHFLNTSYALTEIAKQLPGFHRCLPGRRSRPSARCSCRWWRPCTAPHST